MKNAKRPERRPSIPLLPAAALVLAAACAGEAPAARATVRDSAGIAIAENEWADSASAEWWPVSEMPEVDIGTLEGAEEQTLFRVVDAVRLSDGRIVVANGGTSEVRYYGPDGEHIRTTGRQGGGPGEFQRISGLIRMGGDSLAVLDGGSRRVSILDPSGEFVADQGIGNPDTPISLLGRATDGTWVGSSSSIVGGVNGLQNGLARRDLVLVRLEPGSAEIVDTVGSFAGSESYMQIDQAGGQIRSIQIMTSLPFRKTTTTVVRGDEVFVGTQDAPEVRVYGVDGELRRIVRTGAPSPPVTEEMREAWTDRRVATMPPERQADARAASMALPAGETVPPYGALAVDRIGRLWVQDYAGLVDAPAWTVYDTGGAQVGRVVLPAGFRPFDIGEDWVLGRETDELEVEHVRLYTFEPEG